MNALESQQATGTELLTPVNAPSIHHLDPVLVDSPEAGALPHRSNMHWARKIFHMIGIGTTGLALAFTNLTTATALGILALISICILVPDTLRFYFPKLNERVDRDFAQIMRDYEKNSLCGMSWFCIGLLLTLAFSSPKIAGLACVLLAFGDPWASVIGIKFGRTRIFGSRKTVEGLLGGFTVCFGVSLAYLFATGLVTGWSIPLVAVIAAGSAAAAEAVSFAKLDDNFTIPVVSGAVLVFVLPFFA